MIILSRDEDYAIRALLAMVRETTRKKDEVYTVDELAKPDNLPHALMRRLLQVLAKKGLLISQKGKGGGFRLARSPREYSVGDIVKVFREKKKRKDNCLVRNKPCKHTAKCKLRKKIAIMNECARAELEATKLISLL